MKTRLTFLRCDCPTLWPIPRDSLDTGRCGKCGSRAMPIEYDDRSSNGTVFESEYAALHAELAEARREIARLKGTPLDRSPQEIADSLAPCP